MRIRTSFSITLICFIGNGAAHCDRRTTAGGHWSMRPPNAPEARAFSALAGVQEHELAHLPQSILSEATGKLYLYGGRPEHYPGCFTDLWEMDTRAVLGNEAGGGGGWDLLWKSETSCDPTNRKVQVVPEGRIHHSMAHLQGTLLVFGGRRCLGQTNLEMNDLWGYDLQLGRWRHLLPSFFRRGLSNSRRQLQTTASDADHRADYVVARDTSLQGPTWPEHRFLHSAVTLPGVQGKYGPGIYIFGGLDNEFNVHRPFKDLWRLESREPSANEPEYGQGTRFKWKRLSDAPMPLWGHAAAAYGNRMYVHGGTNVTLAEHVVNNNDAAHLLAVLMYYDAEVDRWQVLPSGKFSRALHTSFVSLGSVSSMWRLENASGMAVEEEDPRRDKMRPLLYVLGGMQPRDNMLAAFSNGSNRPWDAMLMEVYDLESQKWYVETNFTFQPTHPPMLVGAVMASTWLQETATSIASNVTTRRISAGDVAQRLRDSSTWLFGGYDGASMVQGDWGGPVIDSSESTLRYLPRQQSWSRHGGQPAARRDFAAVTLQGDTGPLLVVHGGWVGIAGVGSIASEEVSSVFHDAWAYTGELAEDSMWHELKTRNSLMPRLGHTLVECGNPLSAVMFGGLETNFYNSEWRLSYSYALAEIRVGPTVQLSTSGNPDYAVSARNLPRFPHVVQTRDALLEPAGTWIGEVFPFTAQLNTSFMEATILGPKMYGVDALEAPEVYAKFVVSLLDVAENLQGNGDAVYVPTLAVRLEVLQENQLGQGMSSVETYTSREDLNTPMLRISLNSPELARAETPIQIRLTATLDGAGGVRASVAVHSIVVADSMSALPQPTYFHSAVFMPPAGEAPPAHPSMFSHITEPIAPAGSAGHMLVFGGYRSCNQTARCTNLYTDSAKVTEGRQMSDELWQLDLATGLWMQQPAGPRARLSHVCVMTQHRNMLCYGGRVKHPDGEVRTGDDLWRFDPDAVNAPWREIPLHGAESTESNAAYPSSQQTAPSRSSLPPYPGPRFGASAVPLPGGATGMLLFGGRAAPVGEALGDLWRLDVGCDSKATWTQMRPSKPDGDIPGHAHHALFWMTQNNQRFLAAFGGVRSAATDDDYTRFTQSHIASWYEPSVEFEINDQGAPRELTARNSLWMWNSSQCGMGLENDQAQSVCDSEVPTCGAGSDMEGDLVLLLNIANRSEDLSFLLKDALNGNEIPWKLKEVSVSEAQTSVKLSGVALWQMSQPVEVSVFNSTGEMVSRPCTVSVLQTLTCAMDSLVATPVPVPVQDCSGDTFTATLRILVQVSVTSTDTLTEFPQLEHIIQERGSSQHMLPNSPVGEMRQFAPWIQLYSQEVEHTGFNKRGTYTVRHIVLESSSGMVLAISDYVDLDCRRPSLSVNLQVDKGTIRTKLQYNSVVGREGRVAVPAQSILVVAKQMSSPSVAPLLGTTGADFDTEPPVYVSWNQRRTFPNRFRCFTTQGDGTVTIPVYTSLRHELQFYHEAPSGGSLESQSCHNRSQNADSIHQPYEAQTLDELGAPSLYTGTLDLNQVLMCHGTTTLSGSKASHFPAQTLDGLAVSPNTTCRWIINPASSVKELKLTLVREHMVGNDMVSIRLTNQQDLVAHSGPDTSNWKLYIKATMVVITYKAGDHPHPLGTGVLGSYELIHHSNNLYMVIMAMVIFVVTGLVIIVILYTWRNSCFCLHLPRFMLAQPARFDQTEAQIASMRQEAVEQQQQQQQILRRNTHHSRHLSARYLAMLPTAPFRSPSVSCDLPRMEEDAESDTPAVCSICLEDYEEGDRVRTLPCGHQFHDDCILPWFHHERTCPYCKANVAHAVRAILHESRRERKGLAHRAPTSAAVESSGSDEVVSIEMSNLQSRNRRQDHMGVVEAGSGQHSSGSRSDLGSEFRRRALERALQQHADLGGEDAGVPRNSMAMTDDTEAQSEYAFDGPSGLGQAGIPREEVSGSGFEIGTAGMDEPASLGDRLRAVLGRNARHMSNDAVPDEEAGVAL